MKQSLKLLSILFIAFLFASGAFAQDLSFYLPQGDYKYKGDIPTPKSFMGFEIGKQHATYDMTRAYMALLASKSERVKVIENGTSYEHRPLQFVIISSKENLDNIDAIRENQMKLCDPDQSSSMDIKKMPIIIWLGYSVHGNEASGINASLAVAYFLAAAEGGEIDNILKNSIIIMQPGENPDGIQRFASWVNSARSFTEVSDSYSREFKEPSPSSRANHYWFDLNRDWLVVQHPESYFRNQIQVAWHPTVVGDFHEYGTNTNNATFFSPGKKTSTNPVIPQENWDMTEKMSKYYAKYLDKIGTFYFSKEGYDDWYTGKGAAYPDLMGGVATLFEQPASRGHVQQKVNVVLRFCDEIRNQAYCSYASIKGAMDLKEELQNYQRESYIKAKAESEKASVKGYVFGNPKDKSLDIEFYRILQNSNIDVYELNNDIEVNGKRYKKGESYVVPCEQKEYRIIRTIFEKSLTYRDSTFYDVSAWTVPYGFNMNFSELAQVTNLLGDKIKSIEYGWRDGFENAGYAYLFEVNDFYSYKFLYKILEKGIKVRVGKRPFSININGKKHDFPSGTMYIPVSDQPFNANELYECVYAFATISPVDIISLNSGLGENIDLGSSSFKYINMPRIALVWGTGAVHSGVGEIWHMLDQRFNIPASLIQSTSIGQMNLSKYNIIVLYGAFNFDKAAADKLKAWASNDGNTIIAIDKAYRNLNELGLSQINTKKRASNPKKEEVYANLSDTKRTDPNSIIDGVLLDCILEKESPLAYGITADGMVTYRETTTIISEPSVSGICPVHYKKEPLLSGCITKKNLAVLAETPSVLASKNAVYFVDDPCFRGYWFGSSRLLLNAFFFRELLPADKIVTEKQEK